MKAMIVHPAGGRVPPQLGGRRDVEAQEVAAYLSKLRSLLPLSPPKKRKISKLELIQRVIDYIVDLQSTLEESSRQDDNSDDRQEQQQQQQQQHTTTLPLSHQSLNIINNNSSINNCQMTNNSYSYSDSCSQVQQQQYQVQMLQQQSHPQEHQPQRKPLQPLNTEIAMEER